MARVTSRLVVEPDDDRWPLGPRNDIVAEQHTGDSPTEAGAERGGTFEAVGGPFRRYRRKVSTARRTDGRLAVTTTVEWELAIPFFGWVYALPVRRALARRPGPPGHQPWWAPPARLDPRASSTVGALAAAALVAGYLGTLLTQTITYAADDLGQASRGAQGIVLASVRLGVPLALLVTVVADRRGRRRVLLLSAGAAVVLAATGGLAPSMAWLGASQTLARGCSTAVALLIAVVAAEEMPRGSRAYAVSVLTLAAALGSGLCVMALPLTALGPGGWRLLYLLALAGLPVVLAVRRHLPETRRFATQHRQVAMTGHWGRLALLAAMAFLFAVFAAPASQFQNEFLRTERDYSAAAIALFTLVTNTPAGVGVIVGGRLADTHGRRRVGAVGVVGLTAGTLATYLTAGPSMWLAAVVGGMVGAVAVPALGVYGPELFPTSLRARANGAISVVGVAGSALGLLAAGALSDQLDGVGQAMVILAVGPAALVVVVLTLLPETAGRSLEELNPEDQAPPPVAPPPPSPSSAEVGQPAGDR